MASVSWRRRSRANTGESYPFWILDFGFWRKIQNPKSKIRLVRHLSMQSRAGELAALVAGQNALEVDEEVDLLVVRDERDEQLPADSADERRRREEVVAGDVD